MIGLDLFSGAGGMSLGASMAGVDIAVAVEADQYAAQTYSRNHPGVKLLIDDIRKIKNIEVRKKNKQVIVFGGPPCQGFSTSNQRTRTLENPNNWLFDEFLRIVKEVMPDWVIFENVKGIVETEKGIFIKSIVDKFQQLGYSLSYGVLNSANFGVPQNRSRFFIIGSLHGIEIKMPEPVVSRFITVHEALSDLPDLQCGASENWQRYKAPARSKYARNMRGHLNISANHLTTVNSPHIIERFKHVPQGGNWKNIPAKLMRNYKDRTRCHTGIYHRLRADAPSIVIGNYRKNMLIHPFQDRGLSVREAARLQSFPDSYEFMGPLGFQQQQVGNSVPPLLAKSLFQRILDIC